MSSCLICGGVASLPIPDSAATSGINKITLFHKILQIPLSQCWSWLEDDISFCSGCNIYVDQGLGLIGILDGLETQIKGVQLNLGALLLNQNNVDKGKGVRSKLIHQIKGGHKFHEALKLGQDKELGRKDNEGMGDGIGIITESTSTSEYLRHGFSAQDTEDVELSRSPLPNQEMDSDSEQYLDIYSPAIGLKKEIDVDPLADDLAMDSGSFGDVDEDYTTPIRHKATSSLKKNKYVCLLCGLDCESNPKAALHYETFHPNTTTWPCSSCSRVFSNKKSLYDHNRFVHSNFSLYKKKKIWNFKQVAERVTETISNLKDSFGQILTKLKQDERFEEFAVPMNLQQYSDYLGVISQPMNLQTMATKLDSGSYSNTKEFLGDIDLISRNCIIYHSKDCEYDQDLRAKAIQLRSYAEKLTQEMEECRKTEKLSRKAQHSSKVKSKKKKTLSKP